MENHPHVDRARDRAARLNRNIRLARRRAPHKLLKWAKKSGRAFPWRSRPGAFRILIAEKLLQQTAARDNVSQAYQELIDYCPDSRHLANADIEVLTRIINPLGFVYRARELKALGKALTTNHKGRVPRTLGKLLTLPGVGDYAARAVLSFAFSKDVPVVDTNVARFLHRFFGIAGGAPSNPARNKELRRIATELVPKGRSRDYNFAILDLCAAICTSGNPKCHICPIRKDCVVGLQRSASWKKGDRNSNLKVL